MNRRIKRVSTAIRKGLALPDAPPEGVRALACDGKVCAIGRAYMGLGFTYDEVRRHEDGEETEEETRRFLDARNQLGLSEHLPEFAPIVKANRKAGRYESKLSSVVVALNDHIGLSHEEIARLAARSGR